MSETLKAYKLDELQRITTALNRRAKKDGREEPVAFVASERLDLLDFGILATGNPAVDEALGGGVRRGTMCMVWGKEGTGKTRLGLDWVAYNQKQDPEFMAMWVHLEDRAFPLDAAIQAGIDLDRLLVLTIQSCGEKTFDLMMKYLWNWEKSQPLNLIDMIVVDSVAALLPAAESKSVVEHGLEGVTVGRQAAMMSKATRVLAGTGALGKTTIVFINQVRKSIESYGSPDIMPGGRAIGFYCKTIIRIDFTAGCLLKGKDGESQEIKGHTIMGKVSKNNSGPGHPHARFEYNVYYGVGVDTIGPLIDAAIQKGIIEHPSTAWFILPDGKRINGRTKLGECVRSDEVLRKMLLDYVRDETVSHTAFFTPQNEGSLDDEHS